MMKMIFWRISIEVDKASDILRGKHKLVRVFFFFLIIIYD